MNKLIWAYTVAPLLLVSGLLGLIGLPGDIPSWLQWAISGSYGMSSFTRRASLWALVVVLAPAFGYTMRFTAATLATGRDLAGTTSGTGFQDAVTPPWQTTFALSIYAGIPMVVGLMWWQLGWAPAVSAVLVIIVGASLSKLLLPKPSGGHYQRLILRSMIVRYADCVRTGDVVRADAMKQLLVRAGVDPDKMRGR